MCKKVLQFGAVLLVIGLLVGCAEETTNELNKDQNTVLITISKDRGKEYLIEKEIPIQDGNNLMDVMEENFYIETDSNGTVITSIERLSTEDNIGKAWFYTVNGEEITVDVTEYELQAGDKVIFDFHSSK